MTSRPRVARRRARRAAWPAVLTVLGLLALAGMYRSALQPEGGRPIGGAFTLTDSHGSTRTDRDLRGRFALVFFGYTRCADLCPTTLSVVTEVLDRLDPAATRIQPVFVSVDPAHDTPALLGDYVGRFSPHLLGLTGTPGQLDGIERAYRVTVRPGKASSGDAAYGGAVQHSAALYLLAPGGTLRAAIPADIEAADLEALLRRTLASESPASTG